HHALVGLLLFEYSNLGLLGGNIRLSYSDRSSLRLQGQAIIVTLLTREPSLRDQLAVARIGDIREIPARLRLLQCRLVLGQRRLSLRDLVVKLSGGNFYQQGSGLDAIADVDVALFDVATGAGKNIRCLKSRRGRRQGDSHLAVAGADGGDANFVDLIPALLRCGGDGDLSLVVAPASYPKGTQEQQQHDSAEQRAPILPTWLARRIW